MPNTPDPSGLSQRKAVVSLRTVAEAAGVSRMTVSRAFNPDAQVSEALREKVLQAASEVGYQPDRMVTKLMSSFASRRPVEYRETLAALWWPERWKSRKHPNSYSHSLYSGIEAGALANGCRVEYYELNSEHTGEVLNRIFHARSISGVIVTPPTEPGMSIPGLDWDQFSAVAIGGSFVDPLLHRAESSHFNSLVLVLEQLHKRGFCRPCLLLDPKLEARMCRVYAAAFLAWGGGDATRIWSGGHTDSCVLAQWLESQQPDVIIVDTTTGWLDAIPHTWRHLAFVSMDTPTEDSSVSGIYQNHASIAASAVDLLLSARLKHETGIPSEARILLHPGRWVEGLSVGGLCRLLDADVANSTLS